MYTELFIRNVVFVIILNYFDNWIFGDLNIQRTLYHKELF